MEAVGTGVVEVGVEESICLVCFEQNPHLQHLKITHLIVSQAKNPPIEYSSPLQLNKYNLIKPPGTPLFQQYTYAKC